MSYACCLKLAFACPDIQAAFKELEGTLHHKLHWCNRIYPFSLDTGSVPSDWREALIVPLFKKGLKHVASNYRPVSLSLVACKVLKHIVHSNIMRHLNQNSILTVKQHGFRKKWSTVIQLVDTIQCIASSLRSGKDLRKKGDKDQELIQSSTTPDPGYQESDKNTIKHHKQEPRGQPFRSMKLLFEWCNTFVVLLDFSKAFDIVPHQRLLYKLSYYGVRGDTLDWISSFPGHRKQQVLLDGCNSSQLDVILGVPLRETDLIPAPQAYTRSGG